MHTDVKVKRVKIILVHKPLCKIRHMCAFKPKACNSDYLRYWGTCQIYFTKLNGSVVVLTKAYESTF